MLRSLDIWRSAIVTVPMSKLCQTDLTAEKLFWLPATGDRFTFRADPFGLWHHEKLHVFVERFDYRTAKGEIEVLIFDERLNFLTSKIVLKRPWHLSYPFVFNHDGEAWMLPEANRSGEVVLYRATSFPWAWERAAAIDVPGRAVDATPVLHDGRWWLFYAVVGQERTAALHVAFAHRLAGPWRAHPLNPVRTSRSSARPAGTPVARDSVLELPVQDSTETYGGAVRRLTISRLDEAHFEAEDEAWLRPSPALSPFVAGLHTVSAAGDISLIDCKLVDRSLAGTIAWRRGRYARRWRQRLGREQRSSS